MPLSDHWTVAQYLAACRAELMDPSGRFWTDAELIDNIQGWVDTIQSSMALVRGSTSVLTGTATHTVASDVWRVDTIRWNEFQLAPRTEQDLTILLTEWRTSTSGAAPRAAYMPDTQRLILWPPPSTPGNLEIDYVKRVEASAGTDVVSLPGWVRWTCRPYVAYRAYLRHGPAGDLNKAARYKVKFVRALRRAKEIWGNYTPARTPRLRPALTQFEIDLLNPPGAYTVEVPEGEVMYFGDYVPTGTVNGVNAVFTLPVTPSGIMLFVNGQLQTLNVDYTVVGNTITYAPGSIPQLGNYHVAWVVRT